MDTAIMERNEMDVARAGGGPSAAAEQLAGKYLTFKLADEEYGIQILKVREIIGVTDITYVPQTRDYVRGVVNLRGKVIPVIDLRVRFGWPKAEYNDETCIIVVEIDNTLMGVIVDGVQEVDDLPAADIEPPPQIGAATDERFILGMGKVKERVKILLDIEALLTSDELVHAAAGERRGN